MEYILILSYFTERNYDYDILNNIFYEQIPSLMNNVNHVNKICKRFEFMQNTWFFVMYNSSCKFVHATMFLLSLHTFGM